MEMMLLVRLMEIPVDYKDREEGSESKLNTISDGVKVVTTIVRLFEEHKPMVFFGLISLLLIIIAFVMGAPVLVEFFQTGQVPRFPTLIVAGFLIVIAVLMIICGIILQVVVRKHKELFELELINLPRRNS